MKKVLLVTGLILILILFCSIMLYSQVSSWRSNPPTQSQTQTSQSTQTRVQPSIPQQNNVSSWRNNPPQQSQLRPGSNIIIRDPYWNNYGQGWNNWGWNRWDMWGAPTFGWNYWNQGFYFNDWGYRQPERVYVYDNGKRDTIKGKKPVISFGIQKTTDNQVGGFFTIGNKGYFITEYNFTHDRSTFYPYGRLGIIDFPLVDDLVKLNSFYVGFGKRIKRTGVHFMVGNVNEIVRYRGKDDDGYITFPKYSNRFTTIKIGALHDYKNFTIKMDYDPIISNGTFGLGINF
jgi:hypothetical protein